MNLVNTISTTLFNKLTIVGQAIMCKLKFNNAIKQSQGLVGVKGLGMRFTFMFQVVVVSDY